MGTIWAIVPWHPHLCPPQGSRDGIVPFREVFWGQSGIFSLGIPISILSKALRMELFLLGRRFGDNLGCFPLGSSFPSCSRLQGWNSYPQGGILGYFPIGSPLPSSPRFQGWNFYPWEVFWGNYPLGSPPPSSPRLQGWNCSPQGGFSGIFSPWIPISILTETLGMEFFPQGGILGMIIPRESPFPSSPGLRGWNLSLGEVSGGNLGYCNTFPSSPAHPSPPHPSPPGYSRNSPGSPRGHLCHQHPDREAELPSFPIPTFPGRDFLLPASKAPSRGHGGTLLEPWGWQGMFCHLS